MVRALIAVLVLSSTADAQLFRRRAAVVKRVVVQQVVVPQVQTLFLVAPPSYYGAPAYRAPAPAVKAVSSDMQQIIESLTLITGALAILEQRLDRIEGGGSDDVHVMPPEPVPAVPRIIEQQCGMCHTGPEAKGDFQLSSLTTPESRLKAAGKVSLGLMPLDENGQPATITMETRNQLLSALRELGL